MGTFELDRYMQSYNSVLVVGINQPSLRLPKCTHFITDPARIHSNEIPDVQVVLFLENMFLEYNKTQQKEVLEKLAQKTRLVVIDLPQSVRVPAYEDFLDWSEGYCNTHLKMYNRQGEKRVQYFFTNNIDLKAKNSLNE